MNIFIQTVNANNENGEADSRDENQPTIFLQIF